MEHIIYLKANYDKENKTLSVTKSECKDFEILDMILEANKTNGVADGNYIFVYRNKRLHTHYRLRNLMKKMINQRKKELKCLETFGNNSDE